MQEIKLNLKQLQITWSNHLNRYSDTFFHLHLLFYKIHLLAGLFKTCCLHKPWLQVKYDAYICHKHCRISLIPSYKADDAGVFLTLSTTTSLIGIQSRISVHSSMSTPPVRVRKQKPRASPLYIAAGATGTTPLKQTGLPALYNSSIMRSLCLFQSSTLVLLLHNRCRSKSLFWFIVSSIPKPISFYICSPIWLWSWLSLMHSANLTVFYSARCSESMA